MRLPETITYILYKMFGIINCYRCGLKTKDEEYFKKHDCIKTEANIKFAKGLLENKIDN